MNEFEAAERTAACVSRKWRVSISIARSSFLARTAGPRTLERLVGEDVRIRILGDVAIIHSATSFTSVTGQEGRGRYTDDFFCCQVRSMNVVSTCPSMNAEWFMICRCNGMVVLMPSTTNSASARRITASASARVGW